MLKNPFDDDLGWLIERQDRKWWNGDYFTRDSYDGLRFARRVDAQRVIDLTPQLVGCIPTEHAWMNHA